ncbi:MAG: leucyl aminopeptidase [candidate division Zixibacteria bacterium]|nr:leucyl aminopeptidase [candidate division Zixibacteria bacterium]MDH3935712.1 leucyl aminopeptidase [candidate division Zixibacteria bacterium]MDH4033832.1 leucyl aminopeptidase [candidate division Zixibacteria bacterium]
MKIDYSANPPHECATTALVMFVTSFDSIVDKRLKQLDSASDGIIRTLLASGEFTGSSGEMVCINRPDGYAASRVVLAGLGPRKTCTPDSYRQMAGLLSRYKPLTCCDSATFHLGTVSEPETFQAVIEGCILGSYRMLKYKTDEASLAGENLSEVTYAIDNRRLLNRLQKSVERGCVTAGGQINVRRLSALPGCDLTPKMFAAEAVKTADKLKGLSCRVLDQKEIKAEKMGALMAVAQGSVEPPRFVILEYKGGRKTQKPIVLVGKGVTFDSGGLSLKAADMMIEMNGDMTGAAVVLSTMQAAVLLQLPLNLVGLMPLAENMPSGHAIRPSDVVTTRKGITVEIINTDAEGRLILADALDYANKFDPQAVIDIATLTGATLYILGYSGAPILGNHDDLLERIRAASEATAERVWPLPIWDDFRNALKSNIADIVNSAGKTAGTATAAAFLENFIGDWPWAHIDIAYVDIEKKGAPYTPKGTTGIGVRLLIDLLSNWKKL